MESLATVSPRESRNSTLRSSRARASGERVKPASRGRAWGTSRDAVSQRSVFRPPPAGSVLEGARHHLVRHGGFDDRRVGFRYPAGRVADLPAAARERPARGTGATREPQQKVPEKKEGCFRKSPATQPLMRSAAKWELYTVVTN